MGAKSDLGGLFRVYWSLLLGNVVEWYEYAVYGYLAVYLEKQFFSGSAIGVWLGFGVTFLARPLGGVVMGVIGDRLGRSTAVNISIIGMLVGTCGQGCLPTYTTGAPWLGHLGLSCLIVLRFIQGLSAAGEIATIATYLTEISSLGTLCRITAMISVTANLGFLAAKAVVFATEELLGEAAVQSWAWRLPFLLAIVPGLVAVWGRRGVPESDMFLQLKGAERVRSVDKIKTAFRSHWLNIMVGAGGVACFAILQYGFFVWGQSYLKLAGVSEGDRMLIGLTNRVLQIALALPVGLLGDKFGIGWVMTTGSLGVLICAVPLWMQLTETPVSLTTGLLTVGVGFATLGAFVGTLPFYFVAELFPTEVRNTATGISYNIGFSFFGGLAPILAQAALERSVLGPGVLYALGGLVTVVSVSAGLILQRRQHLTMAHIRKEPYFITCGTRSGECAASSSGDSDSMETSDSSDGATA